MELDSIVEKKVTEWLDNVIGVPTTELGILAGGAVQRWRLLQALNTLAKARDKCNELNLSIKLISPKLICPLLENCSLEDDEFMQDKWANMLVNMLDSKQNIQNHIFPFILSQISKEELKKLQGHFLPISEALKNIDKQIVDLNTKIEVLETTLEISEDDQQVLQINQLLRQIREFHQVRERHLNLDLLELDFEGYEIANLQRLGIITNIPISYAFADENLYNGNGPQVTVQHDGFDYYISELGEMFLKACNEPTM